jgi:hypothetical protein
MNTRSFALLALFASAVVLSAVIAVGERREAGKPEPAAAPLVPGLAAGVNQVVALSVQGAGQQVTLSRPGADSAAWRVEERDGYPAAADEVKRTILALAEARTLEPRTAKPELYAKLGVDEPEQKGSSAVRLSLKLADGRVLLPVLLGRSAAAASADHPGTFYARRAGEAASWLAEGRVSAVPTDPVRWLDRSALPALPHDRVMSVTTRHPDGTAVTASRTDPDQKDFAATGLPEGAKVRQSTVNFLADALEFPAIEDVGRAEAPPAEAITTEFRTFDGAVLTLTLVRIEGKPWISLSPAFDAEQAAKGAALNHPGLLPAAAVEAAVKAWAERNAGWRYRLSDYAAADLSRRPEDLVEKEAPKPEEAKPAETAPAPASAPEPAPVQAPAQ